MDFLNYSGLIFIIIIIAPNVIYAIVKKGKLEEQYKNKTLELFEQIGRIGCIAFMIINPPILCYGFWIENAIFIYLLLNGTLSLFYVLGWIFIKPHHKKFKNLALSILPSTIFIISGIILANYLLILFSVIFAICHVTISYKSSDI